MTILKTPPHAQPRIVAPLGVKPKEAARLIGGSRSEVYRLLRQCRLRAVKRGATLIVLMDSIREHMASLPPASARDTSSMGTGPSAVTSPAAAN